MLYSLFIAVFFFTMTPLVIATQWTIGKLGLPGWGTVAAGYYAVLCKLLRFKIRIVGVPVRDRAVLFVSNHVSWADILVIGSIAPIAFVSKAEVGNWPLVGPTARLQRTVFVDRSRRQQTGDAIADMVQRLESDISVVLFAEGTSNDGNRVLPFRSALIGVVREAASRAESGIIIQPMSISYTAIHGIPMGRQHRPLIAWYGDLDFLPHFKAFLRRGVIDVVVSYGEPIAADATTDRKKLARQLEGAVRDLTTSTLLGRTRPLHAGK
ncbi:MAG TPA: lysophospholipid acyltransferase family protein [Pseudolabrys sp.]|nr:lysophospholipid acyltransferase family protein [Pseudolabrys sp.]